MPRKISKRWWKVVLGIALSSKVALMGAYYMGSKNPSFSKRIEDSLFYDNVPIAKDSFPDPAGLEIQIEVNSNGAKETYLVHSQSGKRWSIAYDMLPKDLNVIQQGLEKRLWESGSSYIEPDEETKLVAELRRLKNEADKATRSCEMALTDFRRRANTK